MFLPPGLWILTDYRRFNFNTRVGFFGGVHNKAPSVVAVRVNNPHR
jgi:hypothetical protein